MFTRLLTCVVTLTVAAGSARAGGATDPSQAAEPAPLVGAAVVEPARACVARTDPCCAAQVAKPLARGFRHARSRPPAAKRSSPPKAGHVRYVVVKGRPASANLLSPLDDEVDAPDDDEDDGLDCPGEALDSDSRQSEFILGLPSSCPGFCAPRFPPQPYGSTPGDRPHPRLVSLCRFRC